MSPQSVDLLLHKQRLQLAAAEQRRDCLHVLDELEAGMDKLTRLQTSLQHLVHSLQSHTPAMALAGLALLIWRPRGVLRWAQRGWLLYLGTQRWRRVWDASLRLVHKLRGHAPNPSRQTTQAASR